MIESSSAEEAEGRQSKTIARKVKDLCVAGVSRLERSTWKVKAYAHTRL